MERPKAKRWLENVLALARNAGFAAASLDRAYDLPLLALTRPAPGPAPRVYLSAGIHGDEPAGPLALMDLLRERFFDDRFTWTLCPLLNPAAWDAGTRENPGGIDLNRDYRQPRSREVRAHRDWLEAQPANDLYLSLHEDWEANGFYLYEINTTTLHSLAETILDAVEAVIPRETGSRIDGHETAAPGLIHHRPEADEPEYWPEAIFHLKRYPHLSYTFETPSARDLVTRTAALKLATQAAIDGFFEIRANAESP